MSDSQLGRRTVHSLFWAVIQSWGGRLVTFALFVALARRLTPADMGMASTVLLFVLFMQLVAELGFGDAIVQRQRLDENDLNLPFCLSLGLALTSSIVIASLAPWIEHRLSVPGLGLWLMVACVATPVTTVSMFQEAFRRRALQFKTLALRFFASALISGVVAVVLAYRGWGGGALVVQLVLSAVVGALWVWWRPQWRPRLQWNVPALRELLKFSSSVVGVRLVDFFTTRIIEMLIVLVQGPAALGLYAVGAKIYQTMMQAVNTAVVNVSLSTMSRVADDPPRLRRVYMSAVELSASTVMPAFIVVAAVAPEVCSLAFGNQWKGAERVLQALMLLGAVQCVGAFNGVSSAALGKPHYSLALNVLKLTLASACVFFAPAGDVAALTWWYVMSQLAVTPIVYLISLKLLGLTGREVLRPVFPFLLAAAMGFGVVALLRPYLAPLRLPIPVEGGLLACSYVLAYFVVAALAGRNPLAGIQQLRQRGRGGPT